jgi:hypothetical protein
MPKIIWCSVPGCRRPMKGRLVITLADDCGNLLPVRVDLCASCRRKALKVPGVLSEILKYHN